MTEYVYYKQLYQSFYLVNAPYNTFILSENGTQTIVTVTEGNYNAISWTTIIANLLNASSTQGWIYSISFPNSAVNVDTGLFTYSCKSGTGTQPIIIFPTTSLLNEQFGFATGSTNAFVGNSLTSANVIKFQVEDVIFIHSDISHNNDQSSSNDVLQEIYASSTPNFTNIIYQNSGAVEAYSSRLLSANNNIYRFTLTDENGNAINLRGLNCVITILVYKKNNIDQLIATDLLMKNKNLR
jgi:hypothetical protein